MCHDEDPRMLGAAVAWQSLRKPVQRLAMWMETKLRANDHKGGWSIGEAGYLFAKLHEECGELARAFCEEPDRNAVWQEAADVANVAMMIADIAKDRRGRAGGLLPSQEGG